MKKASNYLLFIIGVMFLLSFGTQAYGVPSVDVIQSPTGYFVPTDAEKFDSPYYRWWDENWGWTHNPIGGSITTAELNISAFDVDYDFGERDAIYAYDNGVQTFLGYLTGEDYAWSYGSSFVLGANFFDDIAAGLQVWMDIDSTHNYNYWAVTLAKSVISIDGGQLPREEPGVPEPSTLLLLGSGLAGLAGLRKKLKVKS